MVKIAIVLALGGCISPRAEAIAETRLGVHGRRLHLEAHDQIDGSDVYVYCRLETDGVGHERKLGIEARSYDGACVTIVCRTDDDCDYGGAK